jgi:hypothetical protein
MKDYTNLIEMAAILTNSNQKAIADAALMAEDFGAFREKYIEWCDTYCGDDEGDLLTAFAYRFAGQGNDENRSQGAAKPVAAVRDAFRDAEYAVRIHRSGEATSSVQVWSILCDSTSGEDYFQADFDYDAAKAKSHAEAQIDGVKIDNIALKTDGFWWYCGTEKAIEIFESLGTDNPVVLNSPKTTDPKIAEEVGDIIPFGEYDWRVLDVQGDRVLIITKDVVEERVYHSESTLVIWEECDLRKYLNGEFLDRFSDDCKRLINSDVFLLSIEEAEKYFKDDLNRQAEYKNDVSWWWLRWSGGRSRYTAGVSYYGDVDVDGGNVDNEYGGVRPALWVKL